MNVIACNCARTRTTPRLKGNLYIGISGFRFKGMGGGGTREARRFHIIYKLKCDYILAIAGLL